MSGESLVFIAGFFTGIALAAIPLLIIIGRMRVRAPFRSEMRVLKEKCEQLEAEIVSLQKDKELLQSNLISAQNQIAGLESQLQAQKDKIGELKSALDSSNSKLNESVRINRDDHGKILQLQTQLEMERKQAAEKLQLIEGAREQLKNEFMNLANSIFEENSRKFSEQNKNSLDLLLNPLRDQLGDFRRELRMFIRMIPGNGRAFLNR